MSSRSFVSSIHPRRIARVGLALLVGILASCDDSATEPPVTSKKVDLQLTAQVGGSEAGRSIGMRAYYLRTGGQEVAIALEPSTIAVSAASTATGVVSVEVLPCLTDANREVVSGGVAPACRVYLVAQLRSASGAMVSEDATDVVVTMAAVSLILPSVELPAGALVPSVASVDFAMVESGQLPPATTVEIASSSALQAGALSHSVEYLSGSGWLNATIPAGGTMLTLTPTAANLAPGEYQAIVRVTSAWLFTPVEIHVGYRVPPPPNTVTITGAGNGTGLVLVTPGGATCTITAGVLSGFCAVPRPHGSIVTLTPTPAIGSAFTGWSGACQVTDPCTLTMDQARAVTATFTILRRALTVEAGGAGSGAITSAPGGISCAASGGVGSGTCMAQFDHPTQVTLAATPTSTTSTFTGWGGACSGTGACVVTMSEARTVTANFALVPRQLTVTMNGEGAGTVTSTPAGIACTLAAARTTGTCTESFPHGTGVVLTAAPAANMRFTGWSGACTGTGTCIVTMDAARAVTATMVPRQLTVTMVGGGAGTVTSSPEGIACTTTRVDGAVQGNEPPPIITLQTGTCTAGFADGATVVLTVTPAANMHFEGWSGACTGTASACTIAVDGAQTVTANIVPVPLPLTVTWSSNAGGAAVRFFGVSDVCYAECVHLFPAGSVVRVDATQPSRQSQTLDLRSSTVLSGCTFLSNLGNLYASCLVRMGAPKTIGASFITPAQDVTVVGAGTGSGTVVSSSAGNNCSIVSGVGTCYFSFGGSGGSTVTASPAPGSTFSGWAGCIPSTSAPNTCTVGSLKVTATFTAAAPPENP